MQLAKTFAFTVVPAFFISPIAGVWVDRWNNKKTMITCDIIRGCLVLLFPFFIAANQLVPIYIIIFCIFGSACFFLPAKFAIVPDLVPKESLLLANSLSTISTVIGGIAGLTLGGIVLELIDVKNTIYLNSLIYFTSAAGLSLITYRSKKEIHGGFDVISKKIRDALKTSFIFELKEGIRYLFIGKTVRFVIYVLFFLMSIVGAMYVVSVVFIQETMGTMTKDIGLFGLFLCIGLLIGAYIYGKKGQGVSKSKAIYVSLLMIGLFVGIFSAGLKMTGSFLLGAGAMFMLGMASSPILISSSTIVHESADGNMRGRIFSSLGIVMNLGLLIFMFIASRFAEIIGKLSILLICAAVFMIFGLLGLVLERVKKAA